MQDFEEYNTVTLTDENGNDIEFELVDAIEHNGKKILCSLSRRPYR